MPNVQAKRDTCFVWVCKREGASSQSSWSACAEATKAAEALSPLDTYITWYIKTNRTSDIMPDPSGHRPQRTGADMCKTRVGAGISAEADTEPTRRRSNHEWTDDEAGR